MLSPTLKQLIRHPSHNHFARLIIRSGILSPNQIIPSIRKKILFLNGKNLTPTSVVKPNDVITYRGGNYLAITGGGDGRLQLMFKDDINPGKISGTILVHAGYHKCLTEYSKKIYSGVCNNLGLIPGSFNHYFHRHEAFYQDCERHAMCSISGHSIDLDRFEDIRVVRFIRDPRDLLISGYFYHKRAAEHWTKLRNPTDMDWKHCNGAVSNNIPSDTSISEYLNTVSLEEGLLAEIDFRRFHYESMLKWPQNDPRVRLYKYEDIIGNEEGVFKEIFQFYRMPAHIQEAASALAMKYRLGQDQSLKAHIRNASSGQWRKHFTPKLNKIFNERYGNVLERYGYPLR